MKKAGIFKKIVILVLVLIVPGFLYYLLTAHGKNRYTPLRVFGPKQVAKTTHSVKGKDIPDTLYHSIPDFKLTDQNGKQVSLKSFDNKILVINFFYTGCPSVCKLMNTNITTVASDYVRNKLVYFLSITVDPAHDDVSSLNKYQKEFKPFSPKRLFLTGDTGTIYSFARNGLLVNALQTGKDDFIYSDKFILIDPEKHIRGYYNGVANDEVTRLNDEIKVLISEVLRKKEAPLY
ncbi:SCO family protein [Mucilaginibacter sp.]|uniref:SCO family protein n=1 Tax=Mucilaginibacter sp. TaxID=1882438 RepID=UPI003D0AFF42